MKNGGQEAGKAADGDRAVAPSVIDYDADDATRSYLRARECESFYKSLKHVRPRRDFHATLRQACENFLMATISAEHRRVVDGLMAPQRAVLEGGETLNNAHKLFPRGYELLALSAPLTLDSLKSSYRAAVKLHHPDRGGSHMDMVSINEAYPAIHELLCQELMARGVSDDETVDGDASVRSCATYRVEIVTILISALTDDWSLTDALLWLEQLGGSTFARPDALSGEVYWPLIRAVDTLTSRLVAGGLPASAQRALDLAYTIVATDGQDGVKLGLRGGEAAIHGLRRAGINWGQITHLHQGDNLLRLGIIDERHHRALAVRLAKVDASAMTHHKVYTETHGFFQNLPLDRSSIVKVLTSELVPEPQYGQTWINELSAEQQGEYLVAYGLNSSLKLVRKYMYVRFNSLLGSAFEWPQRVKLSEVEGELRLLFSLGTGAMGDVGGKGPEHIVKAMRFVISLSEPDRSRRAGLLRRLRMSTADDTFTLSPFRRRYSEIACWPLSRLEAAVRTGEIDGA